MNNAVLISIKPKWCRLITTGEKTIEVRKSRPIRLSEPFVCYIYESGNGVIGHFTCDDIAPIMLVGCTGQEPVYRSIDRNWYTHPVNYDAMCLSPNELKIYGSGGGLYGWHITNLTLYNTAKELKAFGLTRPPQSWCYVE